MVLAYASAHPEANVTDISKALGISRTTVYKYLEKTEKIKSGDYKIEAETGSYELNVEEQRINKENERLKAYLGLLW